MAELSDMAVDPLVAEQFALLQANRDGRGVIAALDADDVECAEQCLTAIVAERHRKTLRRDMLRARLIV